MAQRSIYQKSTANINMYSPQNRPSKCMKQRQIELKGETDNPKIKVGDVSTSTKKKTEKAQITKIRNKRRGINTDLTEIFKIVQNMNNYMPTN